MAGTLPAKAVHALKACVFPCRSGWTRKNAKGCMASDSEHMAAVRDSRGAARGRGLGFVAISTVALVGVLGAATFGPRSLGDRPEPAVTLAR
jgi:hypothetical protein